MRPSRLSLFALFYLGSHVRGACQDKGSTWYPLTTLAVSRALAEAGIKVPSETIQLPMQLRSMVNEPALEVTGQEATGMGRTRLTLRCRRSVECIPFVITVITDLPALASTKSLASQKAPAEHNEERVCIGSRLNMHLLSSQMSINLPVIALDAGQRGEQIRVATLDHKKVFKVVIDDGATVSGGVE